MARQELFVDLLKLKQVINQLEDEQIAKGAPAHRPFRSRNELHKAVAACDWGQAIGLTPVVVALRIERYAIECKTPARIRGVAVPVAPVAPLTASVGDSAVVFVDTPVATPGAEPGVVDSQFTPVVPVHRKSIYRGIDLEAFTAPFLERGLDITSLVSIVTSSLHDNNTNLKIQEAWHDLRERFSIPRVMDKSQGIESVLPLDQVRLPGEQVDETIPDLGSEPVFGEPVPTEDEPVFGEPVGVLPTDEELTADEFPELYSQEPTQEFDLNPELAGVGCPEGDYEEYPGLSEAAKAWNALEEEDLDQIRTVLDEINQEGEPVYDQEMQTANNSLTQDSEPADSQEGYYQEPYPEREDPRDVDQELEDWLATGEAPMDEHQEPYPENPPQDEYLPLDIEDNPAPVTYDADNYDSSLYETEETDPNETR